MGAGSCSGTTSGGMGEKLRRLSGVLRDIGEPGGPAVVVLDTESVLIWRVNRLDVGVVEIVASGSCTSVAGMGTVLFFEKNLPNIFFAFVEFRRCGRCAGLTGR